MKQQTHCKHGHPFDETNDYRRPDFGWRVCRKCNLIRWHKRKEAAGHCGPGLTQ